MKKWIVFFTIVIGISALSADQSAVTDPWIWLEEVDGINALAWVAGQNQRTDRELRVKAEFESLYQQALQVLNSESRIPSVEQRSDWLYNLWTDPAHPRGIYRRTTLAEFRKAEPEWETVLDLDALAKKEGRPWVFHGIQCLPQANQKCLISLSPGGSDASEVREFDMTQLKFVSNGCVLPLAKSNVAWIDADTIFVSTNFGEGSITESGFPRIVKIWKRGTPLSEAKQLFEGDAKSVSADATRVRTKTGDIDLVTEHRTTWTNVRYQLTNGKLSKLEIPDTATFDGPYLGKLVFTLNKDWSFAGKNFKEGSVVLAAPETLRTGKGQIQLIVEPGETETVSDVSASDQGILVVMLDKVRGRLYRYETKSKGWKRHQIPFPDNGAISIPHDANEQGDFFVRYESFTTPPSLYYVSSPDLKPEMIKAQKATFDASQFTVDQFWTTSTDGTKVPYFAVMKKGTLLDGKNPTHIFSYGGFRVALTPSYSGSYEELSGAYGKLWLERGGVFVVANIRGGGEFGPAWHDSALRENRIKAYEDFEASARDLVARKITSAEHIAIEGRSNGGLLVMSLMTRHPELYGAIICGSPLIDMVRYNKLLAGASWMAEYGNPDVPEDLQFIKTYSPYQNLKAGAKYPPVFFYASTRDDRVHPGHARKMVAKMIESGYHDVWYYENTEGGHHASTTNEQLAYRLALAYTHLWEHVARNEKTAVLKGSQ
jgi:prolyl oligopeptidase